MLKEFVTEHSLFNNGHSSTEPTFYHFNGTYTSQIDYILSYSSEFFDSYFIKGEESRNVSSHVPVQVKMKIDSDSIKEKKCTPDKKGNMTKQTLFWSKIDIGKYLHEIESNLPGYMSTVNSTESAVTSVTNCLIVAAQKSKRLRLLN